MAANDCSAVAAKILLRIEIPAASGAELSGVLELPSTGGVCDDHDRMKTPRPPVGVVIAAVYGLVGLAVVAAEVGLRWVFAKTDPRLVLLPFDFFGSWTLAIPLVASGVWCGIELGRSLRPNPRLLRVAAALHLLGGIVFMLGLVQSDVDCRMSRDGLCFLIGTFFCLFAVLFMILGTLAMALRWLFVAVDARRSRVAAAVLVLAALTLPAV
jgi:hypothetical protein